ncbi:MAG: hypothetical protein JNM88_15195 [Chitinophagaceae bacterium]|nr:hypothetical protein [Chitinophagaceae bacterium]
MKKLTSKALLCLLTALLFSRLAITQPDPGLHIRTFNTPEGNITVYLPPLNAGGTISGTVVIEPAGNAKQMERNRQVLQNKILLFEETAIPLSLPFFKIQLPSQSKGGLFMLTFENRTMSLPASIQPPDEPVSVSPAGNYLPAYVVKGDPSGIKGSFDGDLSNTRVSINGQPAILLAESASGVYFKTTTPPGKTTLACTEKTNTQTTPCNVLQLDLSVGKTNLLKGEQTTLLVKVTGLEGVSARVPLTIQNTSTAVINLQGGNYQQFRVPSGNISAAGVYETTREIQSLRNGDFSVSVSIPPSVPPAALLCNCYINGQTHLLPPSVCANLGGNTTGAQQTGGQGEPTEPAPFPPSASFTKPSVIDQRTGLVHLQLIAPAAAVLFSVKSTGSEQWYRIDSMKNNDGNWQAEWAVPLGNDGLYTIKASVAGKDNEVSEVITQTSIQLTSLASHPAKGERVLFTISEEKVKQAENNCWQTFGEIDRLQQQINELRERWRRLQEEEEIKRREADELAAIDEVLEKIPGEYVSKLKALADSLKKLQGALPAGADQDALDQSSEEAAQRAKDCEDRLNKLKEEQKNLQQQRDDLKKQQDDLLNELDQLHHGEGFVGRHGYHKNGRYWYGYVGDGGAGEGIRSRANEIGRQLRGLSKQYQAALARLDALAKEIAAAEAECDKLRKAAEDAKKAADTGNQAAAVSLAMDEYCRQIQSLLNSLVSWCGAHPGSCGFLPALNALKEKCPKTPAELEDYIGELDNVLKQKQQKEKDLETEADQKAAEAASAAQQAAAAEAAKKAQEAELKRQQEEAERLRKEREKQLEEEREKRRKQEEIDNAGKNTPKPQPPLTEPIDPSDDQLKFQAQGMFRSLYQDYLVNKGPCDCITKAIALANNTNTIVTDIIGRIGVGVAFAPLEAFPGFSLGARLGIGAAKALGSALYGGQNFSEELAKNLFNVIGGEIFPHLLGDDFAGNRLNELAGGALDKILEAEGVRSISWEGETELRHCGKVKGKTVMLVNPNTGWVCIMIKIDNCPLVVIKYKVNKDGVPVTKPVVQQVNG